jgi:hypothetical protein
VRGMFKVGRRCEDGVAQPGSRVSFEAGRHLEQDWKQLTCTLSTL